MLAFGAGLWIATSAAIAQVPSGFFGTWDVTLHLPTPVHFLLELEADGERPLAYADGSPIDVEIDGDSIHFMLDIYDGGDALRHDEFFGTLENGALGGHYIPEYDGVPGVPGDPVDWSARHYVPPRADSDASPQPERMAGFWIVSTRGIKKAITSYTDEGQAFVDQYLDMDDPINRCVNPGLLRTLRARPGATAVDIFYRDGVFKIDYPNAIGNAQRYVYVDGREFPEEIEPTPMGLSIGRWEGDVLHIETRGFTPMYYDSNGAPVSADATLHERLWLDDAGVLHRDYRFHDPRYYTRTLTNNGTLVPRAAGPVESYECDPHPFYRILDISGELADYFERARSWR